MAHKCARQLCGKDLHSYLSCAHVFMPDEGMYFCDAECIRGYNLVNQHAQDRVPCMYRADVVHAPLPRPFAARAASKAVIYDAISAAALGILSNPTIPDSTNSDPTFDQPIDPCFICTYALFQSHLDDKSAKLVDGRPCCESEKDCTKHLKRVEAALNRSKRSKVKR